MLHSGESWEINGRVKKTDRKFVSMCVELFYEEFIVRHGALLAEENIVEAVLSNIYCLIFIERIILY